METSIEEILILVKKKMLEQGGYTRDAYKDYVSETIEYFIEKGKLSEEDNLELIETNLMDLWNEVESEIAKLK
jgi:hypothetical protein